MTDAGPSTAPSAPPGAGAPRPARRLQPRHLGYAALVVIVLVAGYVLVQQFSDTRPNDLGGPSIEQLIPEPDSQILQQGQVGIDLAPGYEATLQIRDTPIPDDQLTKVGPLNQVFFAPGPGKVFESWPAGQSCVVATFWKTELGPTTAVNRRWCFTVL